uniref:Uncharacterized protein n=1 Tax=Haemonchus placei TaxID=6290 RepID=A0A0N4W8J5_HAEPC
MDFLVFRGESDVVAQVDVSVHSTMFPLHSWIAGVHRDVHGMYVQPPCSFLACESCELLLMLRKALVFQHLVKLSESHLGYFTSRQR